MKMSDIITINVPLYQELNIADMLEVFKDHDELKRHLPDRLAKGRQIDRTYFFTVLNTLEPDKLQQIIAHAQVQRNVAQDEEQKMENIKISESWYEQLKEVPFKSSKYSSISNSRRGTWQDDLPSQVEGESFSGSEETKKGVVTPTQERERHASGHSWIKIHA